MALQTEFEFTLPRGFVDKEGNLQRVGTMRLANAKDEILPLQDPRVKQNKAYLIIILLSRVITKLGTLKDINPSMIENLFSADLTFLQSFYRKINEDTSDQVQISCPHCAQSFELAVGEFYRAGS